MHPDTKTPGSDQNSWRARAKIITMVDLMERLDAMFHQESTSYKTVDYLKADHQAKLAAAVLDPSSMMVQDDGTAMIADARPSPTKESSGLASLASNSSGGINDIWREKICEWSYQVIDHFDFSREVVAISFHYLDRFLAGRADCGKKVFQLAAMTTLFLAIKLYEPGDKLSMPSMIQLSRGYFKVEQMVAMEVAILRYVFCFSWSRPFTFCFIFARERWLFSVLRKAYYVVTATYFES
jgi:Cyclin, N-terminal domain